MGFLVPSELSVETEMFRMNWPEVLISHGQKCSFEVDQIHKLCPIQSTSDKFEKRNKQVQKKYNKMNFEKSVLVIEYFHMVL